MIFLLVRKRKEKHLLTVKLAYKTKELNRIEAQKEELVKKANEMEQELEDWKLKLKVLEDLNKIRGLQINQAHTLEKTVRKFENLYDNLVEVIEEIRALKRHRAD